MISGKLTVTCFQIYSQRMRKMEGEEIIRSMNMSQKWRKLRIFSEINNITNQGLRYYQGIKERTAQTEFYGARFNMGIKFDLVK